MLGLDVANQIICLNHAVLSPLPLRCPSSAFNFPIISLSVMCEALSAALNKHVLVGSFHAEALL